jgi:uncharacterized protein with FMN-binding domain
MKEVVYTAIFLALAVLLIVVLIVMFGPKKSSQNTTTVIEEESLSAQYVAGVYTTSIELNDNTFDVQVTVDKDHINSIQLVNLSDTTTAMYPLMEPTLNTIANQVYEKQSTDDIITSDDNKYTSMLLLEAIKTALGKATVQ